MRTLSRTGPRIGCLAAIGLALTLAGCGSTTSSAPVTVMVTVTTAAPATTVESAAAKKADLIRRQKAKAAAARRAKAVAAANALEAAKDRAEVAKNRAEAAAANAWHKGYSGPLADGVYYRYPHRSCESFADDGCWHVEVVTTKGCEYLEVDMNELQGGVVVGGLIDNQENVPAHTPAILELDADKAGVDGGPVQFTCNNY